jgi:hypothetical protein
MAAIKTRQQIFQEKKDFFDALERWKTTPNDKDWKFMFNTIYDVSISLCKRKASGLIIRDLESKALDAACLSMDLIKRGLYPKTGFIAWCNFQVIRFLYGGDQKEIDREYSLNELDEENKDFVTEDFERNMMEKLEPTKHYKKISGTEDYYIGE